MGLKVEIINGAYSRGRVSGLTSIPTPADKALALRRLEGMMAQWAKANICVGYNFEDDPDLNSLTNVELAYQDALETALAMRLLSDFGIEPTLLLAKAARGAFSVLTQGTSQTDMIPYPNRQAVGSGNTLRRNRWERFYQDGGTAPNDCEVTTKMYKGDIDIFVEHFDDWLGDTEAVASYVITNLKPTNLIISADSLTSPDVTYTVEAAIGGTYQISIQATSDLGRVTTRVLFFEIVEA